MDVDVGTVAAPDCAAAGAGSATPNQRFQAAVIALDMAGVAAALEAGADDIHFSDWDGWTALHAAARAADVRLLQALLARGADVHRGNMSGGTALHVAAERGSLEAIAALLAAGADPRALDHRLRTPLHYACQYGKAAAIAALLAAGAHPDASDDNAETPLGRALTSGYDYVDAVQALISGGASVHPRDQWVWSPLAVAVHHNCPLSAKALLAAGAPVRGMDGAGEAPLHQAAESASREVIVVLLEGGADPNEPRLDELGWTPLHSAAIRATTEAVEALVDGGAAVDARSRDGTTPLALAAQFGRAHNVAALLARGADPSLANSSGQLPIDAVCASAFEADMPHAASIYAMLGAAAAASAATGE